MPSMNSLNGRVWLEEHIDYFSFFLFFGERCYETNPIFSLLYLSLVMWSSCDHIVTHCSCDVYCSVMSIVLWPIVQGDSIVPVMAIVAVTLLFSITISTSSLWPYSLRLDFCILQYRQAIRVLFPLSSLVPSTQGICSKAPDCLSSYHLSSETL